MSRDWSIGRRLGVGFALVFVLLAAVLVALAWRLQLNEAAQRDFVDQTLPQTVQAERVQRAVQSLAISARDVLSDGTDASLMQYRAAETEVEDSLRELGAMDLDARDLAYYRRLEPLVSRFALETGRFAHGDLKDEPVALRRRALAAIGGLVESQQRQAEGSLARMTANRDAAFATVAGASVAALLLLLMIGFFTTRSIRRPAAELVEVAAALESGDWDPALRLAPPERANGHSRPAPRDEMARLGQAFGAAAVALQGREQRLRVHSQVAEATSASLDRRGIGAAVLQAILAHVRAEVGVLYECDGAVLRPLVGHAVAGELGPLALGEGLPGQAAREGRAVIVTDIPRDTPFRVKLGYDEAPPRAVAAVPIVFDEETLGVLLVASLRRLNGAELDFLSAAAAQIAVGLKNARAYEEIQRLLAEVREASARIQAQNEQLHAQNEEIQAQSEEIQAQNEEIQAQSEEIQAQNDDLQRQSRDLRGRAEALREGDARKNEFLAMLGHELRNPLAPMSNSLLLLRRVEPGSERAQRAQEVLERQMRHLTRLIDDLLDITRISRGKVAIRRERVNLVDVVQQCIDDLRASIDGKGLELGVELPETPIHVEADFTRLCQVLSNLLANAVKFTSRGDRIQIAVALHSRAHEVAVHITDDGAGIDPALLPVIFEPFRQGESELARTRGGLGLGLALAKALVELHDGRIEAHSDGPGTGAEFVLWLPLADPRGAAQSGEVRAAPFVQARGPRVLIVDDNVDAASSLGQLLATEGSAVELAHAAREGLAKAAAFRPDVILCDIGLPGTDGYAFARRLREDPELRPTLLVALTGYATSGDQRRAASAGFDRHLAKPPDIALLQEILAEARQRAGQDEANGGMGA